MTDKSKILNKDVGIATALGTGLGLAHGLKSDKTVSSTLLGAGIGALVGIFGHTILSNNTTNIPDADTDSAPGSNTAPITDHQQD